MEFDQLGSDILPWTLLPYMVTQNSQHRLLLPRKLEFNNKLHLLQLLLVSPSLTNWLPTLPLHLDCSEDYGLVQPRTGVEKPHSESHKL